MVTIQIQFQLSNAKPSCPQVFIFVLQYCIVHFVVPYFNHKIIGQRYNVFHWLHQSHMAEAAVANKSYIYGTHYYIDASNRWMVDCIGALCMSVTLRLKVTSMPT